MSSSKIIKLSFNPTSVKTKSEGEHITDFMTREFDLESPNVEKELRHLCRNNVHSVNHWIGGCSNYYQDRGFSGHSAAANYNGVWGLALDYDDGELSLAAAREVFKDYIHIIYTSTGHRQDKENHNGIQDRFRVLLPYEPAPDSNAMFSDESSGEKYYNFLKSKYPEADESVFGMHMKLYPFTGQDPDLYEFYFNSHGEWFSVNMDEVNNHSSNKFEFQNTVRNDNRLKTREDLQNIIDNCPAIKEAFESIENDKNNVSTAGHNKRLTVASMIKHTVDDENYVLELFGKTSDFSREKTLKHYRSLDKAPVTCEKLREWGLCSKPCQLIKDVGKKSPIAFAYRKNLPLDLKNEIKLFNDIKDPLKKASAINKFLSETATKQDPLKQDTILKEISKGCKLSIKSLRESLKKAVANEEVDYNRPLSKILLGVVSSVEQGRVAFEWFENNGGKFYHDKEHICYLFYKDNIYRIDSNRPFKSLLLKTANISENTIGGKVIFDAMANLAFEKGSKMDSCNWQYTDLRNNEVYINLNNDHKELLKITPDSIEIIKNGNNEKSIILQDSNKMKPIRYSKLGENEYHQALNMLKKHVFDNLACTPAERYMYLSWALAFPLIEYFKTIPHMRGEGCSSSGKSRSMDVIGHLIYGDTVLKKGSIASNYTDGALNPLIQMDNIETKNLTGGLEDFIITAVTGIEKEKRKLGTDRENVIEKVKTLINSTGIEGLNKSEMINRTFVINFDQSKYGNPEWNELIYVDIVKNRDLMLSAIFQMISGVLKRIAEGELNMIVRDLSKKHPDHSKSRANSYLACMIMIAEKLIEGFSDTITIDELVKKWIETQNKLSTENSRGTNPIIQLLDSLVKDYQMEEKKQDSLYSQSTFINPYPIDIGPGQGCMMVKGTANELNTSFSILAKRTGIKNPFLNAHQLASRLKDSEKILADNNWTFSTAEVGSRKRIYTLIRCESVKVQFRLSQGVSQ